METADTTSTARQMDKQALKVFVGSAAGVYVAALAYCYLTGHLMEMGIVGGVMLGLGILLTNIITSKK